MSKASSCGLLLTAFLLLTSPVGFPQAGPLAYILPATDKVIVVLGDTPRTAAGFQVFRKGAGEGTFASLTPGPILPAADAYQAAQLIGRDMAWISAKVKSRDPEEVWRKLNGDRPMALSLCLVSHGLRLALGRTLVDLAAKPGSAYTYRVITVDSAGKELGRLERQLKVTAPEPPAKVAELRVEAGDGEVKLSWGYPAYTGGEKDRTVAFIVYREETGKGAERLTASPVLRIEAHLEHLDQSARNGTTYVYSIEALDIIGAKSERTRSQAVTPQDSTPPLVPMGLAAVDQEQGVLLVWRMSPELDASHYDVWRGDSLQQQFVKINRTPVPKEGPRYLDTEAVRGTAQYYKVSAVDKNGNESPPAGPVSIIAKDSTPPPPVTGLSFTMDKDKRAVSLSWSPLQVPDLQGYYLYRGDQGGELLRIVGKPLDPAAKPVFVDRGFENKGLNPGASLLYAVSGVDWSANEGEKSFIEVLIPDNVAPAAPLSFGARPTAAGYVDLSWQPCLSADLAAHRIYRSAGGGFQLVAELEKKTASWTDRSVTRGVEYTYRLAEIDAVQNEGPPSKEIRIVPTDTTAPLPPGEVTARASAKGVEVEWQPSGSEDVAGYIVYSAARKTGHWEKLTPRPVADSRFTDARGRAGYRYGVSAVDTSGNEGSKQEGLAQ